MVIEGKKVKFNNTSNPLIRYTDAGFVNTDDMKLTTVIVFKSAGRPILWKAKKQTLNALFTIEAKYITLSYEHQ